MIKEISRLEAKTAGVKRYFTGTPCKAGHIAERYVSSKECCACGKDRLTAAYQTNRQKALEYRKEYRQRHPDRVREQKKVSAAIHADKIKARQALYYKENADAMRVVARERYHQNREAVLLQKKEYEQKNKVALRPVKLAKQHKHLAEKSQRKPKWFDELDDLTWLEAAHLIELRAKATGFKWHADHMVPLKGKTASGLHAANNCQVIPATVNVSKGNRMIYTEPLQWLACLGGNR